MSSFGEATANKLSKESAVRYVTYNKVQVSRTYPKGSRVDSSNYDPTPLWNAGCQIGTQMFIFIPYSGSFSHGANFRLFHTCGLHVLDSVRK